MAAVQQIYEYSIDMKYVIGGVSYPLDSSLVKYFVIDYDYDSKNMPIIYITLTVTKEVYDKLNYQVDQGYISLIIKKRLKSSTLSVWSKYLDGQFTYFLLEATEETKEPVTTGGKTKPFNGDEFRLVQLALLKTDILNKTKKVYNIVLNGVTMMDAIHYGTSHIPMIIEPPSACSFSTLLIPPLTSTSKYLNYLNGLNSFYNNGSYRFFVDFNRGYVLSTSGKAVPAKGDLANSIIIITEKADAHNTKFSGQEFDKDQKVYTLRIPHNEIEEMKNNITNKRYNNIIGVSSSGKKNTQKIKSLTDTYGSVKTTIVRVNNENSKSITSIKSEIENTSLYVSFAKGEIDASVITPNMAYSYTSLSNKEFNGKYLLAKKQEVFKISSDNSFLLDTNITLRKVMS